MDRVEKFLGDRLRGRKVPEDLRRLVEMQLDGELKENEGVQPFGEFFLLGPGEVHPLEEPVEPLASDPEPEQTRANGRAISGVLSHVAPVARDFDGALWGYWLHPDEPADAAPLIVMLNTEGEFGLARSGSLIEVMVFDRDEERDVTEIAAYCEQHRVPFSARSSAELRARKPVVEPAALHERLYKRAQPNHRRPVWADEAGAVPDPAPIGARSDDPRVARVLVLHGFPADPMPLIRAADTGEGEVVLRATQCKARFEFHRENDTTWFLHEMRFVAGDDDAPACTHVPFELSFDETREQCGARFGEPAWKSPWLAIECWRFGRVTLHVTFGKNHKPSIVQCMATQGKD
jgi:hypothetical protein